MNDELPQNETDAKAAGARTAGSGPHDPGPPPQQNQRAVSDPREVATLVMSRIHQVNVKKDELTIAIKGLSDMTQQLARAYAQQSLRMEQLARRVDSLETAASLKASSLGVNGTMAADQLPH